MSKNETIETYRKLYDERGFSRVATNGKKPIEKGWPKWCITPRKFDESIFVDQNGNIRNAAVACGPASGVLVLDIDDEKKFEDLCNDNELSVPDTFTVRTGRGGRHLYYAYPDDGYEYGNKSNDIYDIRGVGGVAIAPGSTHPETGIVYSIERDIDIVEAPDWLKDEARKDVVPSSIVDLVVDEADHPVSIESTPVLDIESLDIPRNTKNLINQMTPVGNRSTVMWKVIKDLVKAGVTKNEIDIIFENCAVGAKFRQVGLTRKKWLEGQIDKAKDVVIDDLKSNSEKEVGQMLNLLEPGIHEIFRSGSVYFVRLFHKNALVTVELESADFQDRVNNIYYDEYRNVISKFSMSKIRQILRAIAISDEFVQKVYVRIAYVDDKIYLDLGDSSWRVVEIDCNGWRVIDQSPVPLIRTANMLPLPVPDQNSHIKDINMLKALVNCSDEHSWTMLIAWIISCFFAEGTYYLLSVHGAPGSAKSTLVKLLHSLIDPSKAKLKAFHRNVRELMVAARLSKVMSFDNLSGLTKVESDALCRLSTGGSFGTKENYTDGKEYLIEACRPVIINGVSNNAVRGDLVDRVLSVELERLPDDKYIPEDEIMDRFEQFHPRLLGAICNIISEAMQNHSNVKNVSLGRMAKAAKWVIVAEPGLGWQKGHFVKEYRRNQRIIALEARENNSLLKAIIYLLDDINGNNFTGTPTHLYDRLNGYFPEQPYGWPKSVKSMSTMIKNMIPVLKRAGIEAVNSRVSDNRLWSLTKIN